MATLHWGVKQSLIAYVRGQADGAATPSDGADERDGTFVFPGASDEPLAFDGCVTVTAHDGLMNVPLRAPSIHENDGRAELFISDPEDAASRMRFATITELERHEDGTVTGRGVALALPGSDLFFFGPYGPGTALDDLLVAV